jgi:hypothetical protein
LMKPLTPKPISYAHPQSNSDDDWLYDTDGKPLVRLSSLTPVGSASGSGHELTHVLQPKPNPIPGPSTDGDFDWNHWSNIVNQRPPKQPIPGPSTDGDFDWSLWTYIVNQPEPKKLKLTSSKKFGQGQLALAPQPKLAVLKGSDSGLDDYIGLDDLLPLELPSSEKFDQTHEDHVVQVPPPNLVGPSTAEPFNQGLLPSEPWYGLSEGLNNEVAQGLPPRPDSTDPELHSDHQPLSTDSQPPDPEAIEAARIYAAKGKAKQTRSIPGTARDVRNAVQREFAVCVEA